MKKGWKSLAALGMTGVLVAAAPAGLRHMSFFQVRRVELIGVRYLAPDSVLAVLALRPDQNVFEDGDEIARRAEALGGVVSARVSRKLPGTLRVTVIEKIPVAFAPGPNQMVALDGDAKPLPYDPAATGLDLPVIQKVDSLLVRTLSVLRLTDSALFQDVDAARRLGRGGVTLMLGERRVLLPGIPAPDDVRALAAVRRHLASTGRRFTEIDTRFEGWFVVRRSST